MKITEMRVRCAHDKLVAIEDLKLDPKNRNIHPPDQIKRLAEIMAYQGWRYCVKVSNQTGIVRSGHGRIEAAKLNGWTHVPVNFQDYDNPEQEYSDSISDNAVASWSELDLSGINTDLGDLGPDFDINLLGIKDFVIDPLDKNEENNYSRNVESPVYAPRGEKPKTSELYNIEKTSSLLKEISSKDIEEDLKLFLQFASHRHTIFNYEKIAEYYAHASKDIQDLIENSALVIIDFDKAISLGFVKLSEKISEAYRER